MTRDLSTLDNRLGIGLRNRHLPGLLHYRPNISWVEIHSENWMFESGPIMDTLHEIKSLYPISLHCVGLSLGSVDGIDTSHIKKLKQLIEFCEPILVSDHISWGAVNGIHSNDLLPMPYHRESIRVLVRNIDLVQQLLGRQILVENISSYVEIDESEMKEWEFVRQVVEKANCRLLLDLNNIVVNAHNHQFKTSDYLAGIPWNKVDEIHLAGYECEGNLFIDTHGREIQPPVWELFSDVIPFLNDRTRILMEWDNNLPSFERLIRETVKVDRFIKGIHYEIA